MSGPKASASDGRALRLDGASSFLGHLISPNETEMDLASNSLDGRFSQLGFAVD